MDTFGLRFLQLLLGGWHLMRTSPSYKSAVEPTANLGNGQSGGIYSGDVCLQTDSMERVVQPRRYRHVPMSNALSTPPTVLYLLSSVLFNGTQSCVKATAGTSVVSYAADFEFFFFSYSCVVIEPVVPVHKSIVRRLPSAALSSRSFQNL